MSNFQYFKANYAIQPNCNMLSKTNNFKADIELHKFRQKQNQLQTNINTKEYNNKPHP